MSDDRDKPDDDADTPPDGRIIERVNRRNAWGDRQRGEGFRKRDTAPLPVVDDCAPREADDDDVSQPLRDLSEEGQAIYDSLRRKFLRATNRTLLVEQAVAHQPETKIKQWSRVIAEKAIALLLGGVAAWLLNAYNSARSEMSDQHDRILELELRLRAIERRMPPDILQAGRPAKEP